MIAFSKSQNHMGMCELKNFNCLRPSRPFSELGSLRKTETRWATYGSLIAFYGLLKMIRQQRPVRSAFRINDNMRALLYFLREQACLATNNHKYYSQDMFFMRFSWRLLSFPPNLRKYPSNYRFYPSSIHVMCGSACIISLCPAPTATVRRP